MVSLPAVLLSLALGLALVAVSWLGHELRVARRAAREANGARSEFAANISHELRTPLNGVIGTLALLAETKLDSDQRDLLGILRSSSESLLGVITDILDFAKIEAGQVQLETAAFDLEDCIETAVQAARLQAAAKGLQFTVRIDAGVPRIVRGDARRLRQVLVNLTGNAVKFTDTGEVRCEVGLAAGGTPANALLFRVSDTGIGIPPGLCDKLFTPFFQGDSSSSRKYGGSGLGLATARRLVQLMAGSLGFQSERGRGSTFWFLVPLERAELPTSSLVPSQFAGASAPNRGAILIVDDNPVNQLVAAGAVARLGYQAERAEGGEEALEAFRRARFDAVLMDCQMPVMDGYETAAAIRRLENGGPRTPIIAMTANPIDGDQERCRASGMDDYLPKPLRFAALDAALKRWIVSPPEPAPGLLQDSPDH